MPSPPIALFMTTIASQPALRQRQEYILRILQVKKIPYTAYDLASDENAKRIWRRKAPADKQQLPGILVGDKFPGDFTEFEDAVEHDELDIFLRLKETWDPLIDEDRPAPEAKPVGIPGAMTPLQMTPDHLKKKILAGQSPSSSPLKGKSIPVNKRTDEFDVGDELSGYGLQGVKVTMDELRALVEELGLEGEDAGDLVKGLGSVTTPLAKSEKKTPPLESAGTMEKTETTEKTEITEQDKMTKQDESADQVEDEVEEKKKLESVEKPDETTGAKVQEEPKKVAGTA